jgi:hypothetical protein
VNEAGENEDEGGSVWERPPYTLPTPAAEDLHLRIALGACRFKARAGEGDGRVAGTYHDLIDRRSARILEEGASVTITETEPSFERGSLYPA